MKLVRETTLFDVGGFSRTEAYARIHQEIADAILRVAWPPGSSTFVINPERHGNGVEPIKKKFMEHLEQMGWRTEHRHDVGVTHTPGPIDATKEVNDQLFAVEWETGNISSSHRALNKMVIGILRDVLIGGILVLPTRQLYPYLTDRIGNFSELEPYFDVWRSVQCQHGILGVIGVEHDELSREVIKIPKRTDGRALR